MHKNYLDLSNYLNIAKMIIVENGTTQETFKVSFVILDVKNM